MNILLIFTLLYSINEICGFALSGYKLRKNHLKYYFLNTPEKIDYSMSQFILRTAFNEWSKNCNFSFEFIEPKMHNNLIKQNLITCRFPKYCHKYFVLKDDIDILVIFSDTIKAKQGIYTFENVSKSFIKNELFGWAIEGLSPKDATVSDPNVSFSLLILDYDQNCVPILQTHDYTAVNLLGVFTHEFGQIVGLTHSRDRFSIMSPTDLDLRSHPNYWS